MEKISQILDNIKDRLTSPLIFSFVVAWLVINWPITIALIWYDPPVINQGYLSLIDHIRSNTNFLKSFCYPATISLIYTFVYPFIKLIVSMFQTWIVRKEEDVNLGILKSSKVSMDKYLSFKIQYEKRSAELEKAISSETVTQQQLEEVKTALMAERNQQNKLSQELSDVKYIVDNISNIDLLRGRWIRTLKTTMRTTTENIEIQNNNLYIYNGNAMEQKYSIHDFYFNSRSKVVHFTLFHASNQKSNFFSYNQLTYRHRGFSGMEYGTNGSAEVSYSRDDESEEELVENTEENQENTDRKYWLNKGTPETVKIADEILALVNEIESGYSLKYNKFYIGMIKGSEVENFAIYRPKKDYTRLELRIPKSPEVDNLVQNNGLKQMEYEDKWGRYRLRLTKGDVSTHRGVLLELLNQAKKD